MATDGDPDERPIVVYDTMRIGLRREGITLERGVVDFAGEPDPSASALDVPEAQLLALALQLTIFRELIGQLLGLRGPLWFASGILRRVVLPDAPDGKPGDFDLVVGQRQPDGAPSIAELGLIEVKRLLANPERTNSRGATGYGKSQASQGVVLGFDRVALLHFLVSSDRQLPEGFAGSWSGINNADHGNAIPRATGRLVDDEAPYGAAVIAWGRASGADPRRTGALQTGYLRPAPVRPWGHYQGMAARRDALHRGIGRLLAAAGAWPFYFACDSCGRLQGRSDPEPAPPCRCRER